MLSFINDFGPTDENTKLGTHLDVYRPRYPEPIRMLFLMLINMETISIICNLFYDGEPSVIWPKIPDVDSLWWDTSWVRQPFNDIRNMRPAIHWSDRFLSLYFITLYICVCIIYLKDCRSQSYRRQAAGLFAGTQSFLTTYRNP